ALATTMTGIERAPSRADSAHVDLPVPLPRSAIRLDPARSSFTTGEAPRPTDRDGRQSTAAGGLAGGDEAAGRRAARTVSRADEPAPVPPGAPRDLTLARPEPVRPSGPPESRLARLASEPRIAPTVTLDQGGRASGPNAGATARVLGGSSLTDSGPILVTGMPSPPGGMLGALPIRPPPAPPP